MNRWLHPVMSAGLSVLRSHLHHPALPCLHNDCQSTRTVPDSDAIACLVYLDQRNIRAVKNHVPLLLLEGLLQCHVGDWSPDHCFVL